MVTYGFAIFGMSIIAQPLVVLLEDVPDPTDPRNVKIHELLSIYGGLDAMMFTLVQVLTWDSMHAFIRDTIVFLPFSWLFFYAYIAVASLVLMNLVTAIIVENAMATSQNDHQQRFFEKKEKQKREMKELKTMFDAMDRDSSGAISWQEFRSSFQDEQMAKKWLLLDFKPDDCRELFQLLDDGDGQIVAEEFFEGLMNLKGLAQARDLYSLSRTVGKLQHSLDHMNDHVSRGKYSVTM